MRGFTKFGTSFFHSPAIQALTDDGKWLQVYFIAGPHQNSCGCFPLPDGYAASDLRWEIPRYYAARTECANAGLILFDKSTSEILVHKWFRHNPPMNPNHRKAIIAAIEAIASEELRAAAWQGFTTTEADARAKQDAKAQAAAAGNSRLHTALLSRIK